MNDFADRDLEALLQKYKPTNPPARVREAISRRVSSGGRTWPWALAASVLFGMVLGLHGRVDRAETREDDQRADTVLHALDATADGPVFAAWIAHREAAAASRAEEEQAALLPGEPDQMRR